ncbi:exosortase F system-associated protein [uncultured Algibacter sp.]|uniref:exosortase F system-associated membrane protein n=1 Tax=uncultured Algibacter sp. TaxID=298659 RepID=UPI003216EE0D
MHKAIKYVLLFTLFLLLILIRAFENDLFYDPYITFFKNDYLYMDSPRREIAKLIGFTTLRYVLNSGISLVILYVFFKDKSIIKFSMIVYVTAFVILITLYLYFVINAKQEDYYLFFNMRRFLIQPIILILLLPAFYYQRLKR